MAGSDLLDTINNIRSASGQPVMNPLLAAAIQSHTAIALKGANDRAAEEQTAADDKTTFMIKGDKVSVKNFNTTDFIKAADESGSLKVAQVKELLRPAAEAAKTHELVKSYGFNTQDPNDPQLLKGDQGDYRAGYRMAREQGFGMVQAALHGVKAKAGFVPPASSPASDASWLQAQRAGNDLEIANKAVLPQQEQQIRERSATRQEARAQQTQNVGIENEFEKFTSTENVVRYPDADSLVAAGKRLLGDQWTPERESAALTAQADARGKVASSKVATRRLAFRQITPEAVGFTPDAKSFIDSIEDPDNPFTEPDRKYAENLYAGKKKEFEEARGQKKMQMAQESARLQLENNKLATEKMAMNASQLLQNPKTRAFMIHNIAQDGDAYFSPAIQKNSFVKNAIDGELLATVGRTPNKLDTKEHDALTASRTGNMNLDQIEPILQKWQKRGFPITGAMVGRFEDWTAKFGATGLLAARGVPQKYQAEMATDINNTRTHLLNLTVQEARTSTGGGRLPAQVIEMFKQTSPALFQDGPLLAGATTGVRSILVNRANATYERQWGPDPPVRMLPNGKIVVRGINPAAGGE